jgi:hypothetical protein
MDADDEEPGHWSGANLDRMEAPGLPKSVSFRSRSSLQPAAFLSQVSREVISRLAERGARPETNARGRLAKFWYGPHSSIHYEVWLHDRTLQLEIGLHAESTPEYNLALYNAFDRCMLEVQAALGASFWLEEWDHGWIRLYETHPFFPLDAARVDEIAARTCEIIHTLQPVLEDIMSALPSPPPAQSERRRDRHPQRR